MQIFNVIWIFFQSEGNNISTDISPSIIWLSIGALLVFLEIVMLQGVGFLFAALGAISVGAFLIFGLIDDLVHQFILFFAATAFWTALLWRPLKQFITGRNSGFNDMVGSTAIVYDKPLEIGKIGQVKWSGTIMKCELVAEALSGENTIDQGCEVTITGVSKGILMVRAKQ